MADLSHAVAFITGDTLEQPFTETPINFALSGDNVVIAPVASKAIYVYKYFLVVSAATNLTFKDNSTALTGPIPLAANEAMVFTFDTRPWFTTAQGDELLINISTGVQVSGRIYYLQQ